MFLHRLCETTSIVGCLQMSKREDVFEFMCGITHGREEREPEIAELKEEIKELKANKERLKDAWATDLLLVQKCGAYPNILTVTLMEETPAQSLREIQADAGVDMILRNHHINLSRPQEDELFKYINKLREGEEV